MVKDRLFELIRDENVVLFVGAGFSLYSGYPSGAKLAEIIYKKLAKEEQEEIDKTLDLPKLAEEIYNLHGNDDFLFGCLKEEFTRKIKDNSVHITLSTIPHFRTIITTNYDTLFEDTYKDLQVARKSLDIPLTFSRRPCLFKIHGDLTAPDRIILKQSDYNNYFVQNSEQTIFWNEIKSRLASNPILFIGYSFEDINVKTIIERIYDELGHSKQEAFFVAPYIKHSKQKYLERKGIQYIKDTAENIIKQIHEDLLSNYIPGLSSGHGSMDTASAFALNNGVHLALRENLKKDGINIEAVHLIDDKAGVQKIKFSFGVDKERSQFIEDYLRGKKFGNVEINSNEITDFSHLLGSLRLRDNKNIKAITLLNKSLYEGKIDLVFEDGFEALEFDIKIFKIRPIPNQIKLRFEIEGFSIETLFTFTKELKNSTVELNIRPEGTITNVNKGINSLEILTRIHANIQFKAYINSKKIFANPFSYKPLNGDISGIEEMIQYFKSLKKIESYFDKRFTAIDIIKIDQKNIRRILAYIDKKPLIIKIDKDIKFDLSDPNFIKYVITMADRGESLIWLNNSKKIELSLHGQHFNIGYEHRIIQDVIISNIEELQSNKTNTVHIMSKRRMLYIQYLNDRINFTKKYEINE